MELENNPLSNFMNREEVEKLFHGDTCFNFMLETFENDEKKAMDAYSVYLMVTLQAFTILKYNNFAKTGIVLDDDFFQLINTSCLYIASGSIPEKLTQSTMNIITSSAATMAQQIDLEEGFNIEEFGYDFFVAVYETIQEQPDSETTEENIL